MALTVEDGTGLETADAYVAIATVDAYFDAKGNTVWSGLSSEAKEDAIRNATLYADLRWGHQLRGQPLVDEQALEFPRNYLYDRYGRKLEGVPTDWERAISEYALLASSGELFPASADSPKEIKREKVSVGPVSTETEYMGTASKKTYLPYPAADNYAKKFTRSGISGGQAIRN